MQLPLPTGTRYDQAVRYLLLKAGALLLQWLLRLTPEQLRFVGWMPTQLTLPGVPQRICDGIAELADLQKGGLPFAAILEIQTRPDDTMPGRLMLAGALCWLTLRPTRLPGDRYELVGIVVNLTGKGDSARSCTLGAAEWILRPCELNLETFDAGDVLGQIAAGKMPREFLALIPVMQRGADPAIIEPWLKLASAEEDLHRRGDYALALVFADLVGRREVWQEALKGFTMIESPIIAELLTTATIKAKIEALVLVVQGRYRELPDDIATAIRASTDLAQLNRWLSAVATNETLAEFRQKTGI